VQLHYQALWATGTNDKNATLFAVQSDGNLVVYPGRKVLWASGTNGIVPVGLYMQDGNLVLYQSTAKWASHTNS